ncbi:type VI secretion system Vgr family protein [Variovorax boronicumulans]|uniref:type VI secretion system Vgr family protein n=1 Tax=Variovorax boronicumulans TaxID=436515 RepID=UPI0027D77198|nr:type VI secretion system Vgr family protein [Variovorax boronicumulans]
MQREAVSQPFEMRIVCLSLRADLALSSMIDQPLTLVTVLASGSTGKRTGLIRAVESLGSDGGLARYRLTLVPWIWLATQQGRSQVFQQRSVADIIERVLAPYADAGSWAVSSEVSGFLADAPIRTYCTQYRESDFDFFSRLLTEEGLAWRIEEDEKAPLGHKLVIFSANDAQPADPGSPIRFHRKSSQERSDAVQALVRRMRQSVAQVHLSAWNVDGKRQLAGSAAARFAVGGKNAPRIEYDDVLGLNDRSRGWDSNRTLERYAGLMMEAAECRADVMLGHSTVRTLRAGTRIEVDDAPALGLQAKPALLLDTVEHVGINNLPKDTAASIAAQLGDLSEHLVFDRPCASVTAEDDVFGLVPTATGSAHDETNDVRPQAQSLAAAKTLGYANSFSAVHVDRPWRPVLAAADGARLHAKPTASGVHSAIVVGPSGETSPNGADELYCNDRGDVRVRFHWQTNDSAGGDAQGTDGGDAKDNLSTRWIRVAQRQAGPGMGWQWLPRIGQEVLVKFVDLDVDQPVIVGALYNGRGDGGIEPTPGGASRNQEGSASQGQQSDVFAQARNGSPSAQANLAAGHAPAWHGSSADDKGHRNAAALSGFKTKEFGGEGFSQLVFDDSNQQLRVQLHASTAHSQLNLGHLIHQADNFRGSFRGQGLELRTDGYAALRGGKGVLLSTYHGAGGKQLEPVGDFAAGMALLKQVQQLGQALSEAAMKHETVQLAGHIGSDKANASQLDKERAPYAAMEHAASGMVAGDALETAYSDASEKSVATGDGKVPHTTDAVVALAARGGLAMIAGQQLQMVAGETATLASGGDINLALADVLRVHSGQAIGLLAGAQKADAESGLSIIAGSDDLDFQAQHDELRVQAKDALKIASTDKTVEFAAQKKIRVATAQGASITLQNGDITFECPGKITYHAIQRKLAGPVRQNYPLPQFPRSAIDGELKFDLVLKDMPGPHGVPHINTDWRIVRAETPAAALISAEEILSGCSDDDGKLALGDVDERQLHEAWNRTPNALWIVSEGHAHELALTRDPDGWTDEQQRAHAMDAMGYSDDLEMVGDDGTDVFHRTLAERDLRLSTGAGMLKKIKG